MLMSALTTRLRIVSLAGENYARQRSVLVAIAVSPDTYTLSAYELPHIVWTPVKPRVPL
jgi:hypothetical protein